MADTVAMIDTRGPLTVSGVAASAVDVVDLLAVDLDESSPSADTVLPVVDQKRRPAELPTEPARGHQRVRVAPSAAKSALVPAASIATTMLGRDRVLLQVRGRLDRVGIARLRTALTHARALGTPKLVLDLAPVMWWDHSLAGALAWARLQLRAREQHLILTGASAELRTEIDSEQNRLGYPLWRGLRPGQTGYRPETADQP